MKLFLSAVEETALPAPVPGSFKAAAEPMEFPV